jgi:hypothetical protein
MNKEKPTRVSRFDKNDYLNETAKLKKFMNKEKIKDMLALLVFVALLGANLYIIYSEYSEVGITALGVIGGFYSVVFIIAYTVNRWSKL